MNDGDKTKNKHPATAAFSEEIHKVRLKPGVFFASQEVARAPMRFASNVLGIAPPTFL
jgi:hypothetical protein